MSNKFIHDDIAKSQSDFGVAVQNTQKAASQLQTKVYHVTEVAKEKLSDAAQQLHHKIKVLSQKDILATVI